jgi:hypothetical protein
VTGSTAKDKSRDIDEYPERGMNRVLNSYDALRPTDKSDAVRSLKQIQKYEFSATQAQTCAFGPTSWLCFNR